VARVAAAASAAAVAAGDQEGLIQQRFIKYGWTVFPCGYRIAELGPKCPGRLDSLGDGPLRCGPHSN